MMDTKTLFTLAVTSLMLGHSLGSAGCSLLFEGDATAVEDVDTSTTDTDAADIETGPNACGGDQALAAIWNGRAPGDTCGGCGRGVVVCADANTLRCAGGVEPNACGGCGALAPEPEGGCTCGDWVCNADGSARHCDAQVNGCGGCLDLAAEPGSTCNDAPGPGIVVCAGEDAIQCASEPYVTACGEPYYLPAEPGRPCGTCDLGRIVCDGHGRIACDGEDVGVNALGGCGPLRGIPGETCGCDGTWQPNADGTDVICVDEALNACGGCAPLGGAPGDNCEGGQLACSDDGTLACVDATRNPCGGTAPLAASVQLGEACGDCESGRWICAAGDAVCAGEVDHNACGGCGPTPGVLGEACDDGRVWACDDRDRMVCGDACGGTVDLPGRLGDPCGVCGEGVVACDDDNSAVCLGAPETAEDIANVQNFCIGEPGSPLRCDPAIHAHRDSISLDGQCFFYDCTPDDPHAEMGYIPGDENSCGGCPEDDGAVEGEPCTQNRRGDSVEGGTWQCRGTGTSIALDCLN